MTEDTKPCSDPNCSCKFDPDDFARWMDSAVTRVLGNAIYSAAPAPETWPKMGTGRVMPDVKHNTLDVLLCCILTQLASMRLPLDHLIDELNRHRAVLETGGDGKYGSAYLMALQYAGQLFLEAKRQGHNTIHAPTAAQATPTTTKESN